MARRKEKDPIIEKARKCLKDFEDREQDNISRAKVAIKFRAGEQWPTAIKQDRENPNQEGGPRPCPVLDKTNQYVRQVINEERQNRSAIKVRPVDDHADKKVAEVLTGIIRHIEDRSEAIEAYSMGGEHAIDGGFGYWRLLTEYDDPLSFDQDIRIKRIPNRFSVALGPHTEPDGSDCSEAVIWEDLPIDEFEEQYPKASLEGFEPDDAWKDRDTIRVAEYMTIERQPMTLFQLEDGQVVTEKPKAFIATRQSILNKVKWRKITGKEVLEEKDMPGSYIPVVKVVGNELTMPNGKIRLSGAIESMMDPQRLHNYAHAGFIENVGLAPRAPWLAEESQVEGYEEEYGRANRTNLAVLKYKASVDESGKPIPPPQRIPPAGLATGWDRMLQHTEHGIEGSIGMYGPSVGAQSQEKSGIALQEQKSQGMVGNYHFPDNLARSIQHTGKILIEWIPKIYDTERVARMLGEDGDQELVYLNPDQEQAIVPQFDQMGQEIGSIYNINVGKYDVTVSTGPSYTAKRQEAAQNQIMMVQAQPELMGIIGDLMLKNMDWPESDKIAERLATMLPPEIKELENDGPIDPKVRMAMQQIEQTSQMIEEKAQALQGFEQEVNQKAQEVGADKTEVSALRKELAAERKVFQANVREEMAKLELFGTKLVDQIEDITDPIAQQLTEASNKQEPTEDEEPEEDNESQEILKAIAELTVKGQTQMIETVMQAMERISQSINAPRQVTLQTDAEGNPVSSTSQTIQ